MKIKRKDVLEFSGAAVMVIGSLAVAVVKEPMIKKIILSALAIFMWILSGVQVQEYRALPKKEQGDLIYTLLFFLVAVILTGAAVFALIQ